MEQDTLEDYLGIPGLNEKNAHKFKNILTTAQKRKECERKALAIVQLLLQKNVSAELFLKSLRFLNKSYYEDVAEERGLIEFCGYPLCGKSIKKTNYKYQICSKLNKVYDLEQYGNFCSCPCYDANEHIKSQILDSPLWLRDDEDIPKFNLLVRKKNSGSVGIDIKSKKPEKNDEFIPISSFAKLSLEDFGDIDISVTAMNNKPQASVTKKIYTKLSTVMENEEEIVNIDDENTHSESSNTEESNDNTNSKGKELKGIDILKGNKKKASPIKLANYTAPNILNNSKENGKKQTRQKSVPVKAQCLKTNKDLTSKDLKSITDKIKRKSCKPKMTTLIDALPINLAKGEVKIIDNVNEVEKSYLKNKSLMELKFLLKDSVSAENIIRCTLKKWITLETLIFIHGEKKIKEILDENKLTEHFEKLKIHQLEIEQQRKYIDICRKLCEQEIFEEKVEGLMIKNKLKPIPDYNALKKESKELIIKVNTFYKGSLCETPDPNFGSNRIEEETDGQEQSLLPLPDVTSQNAERYKILSDAFDKNINSILKFINYDSPFFLTQMHKLIKTFDLDAKNIVFKPAIGNYLSLICLRILSIKDSTLHEELEKKEFSELENSVFEQFPGKKNVLTDTLKLINDIDNFVESSVKS
ncbi:putative RNA polymerase II subunit B1 CTD phosphatase RPAP2 [Harmonia axyridis]|uniref:putative RNA polymerase II subunit B1 CTD phosphatase RPAP2 n=1 Tax=Harmonia axyridis TaxID=115357 RepID=UPI001E278874|nr:putative RNA polymerase II subunit B1 CTD phosphatase RPAP2 [Harmonia axyridis]